MIIFYCRQCKCFQQQLKRSRPNFPHRLNSHSTAVALTLDVEHCDPINLKQKLETKDLPHSSCCNAVRILSIYNGRSPQDIQKKDSAGSANCSESPKILTMYRFFNVQFSLLHNCSSPKLRNTAIVSEVLLYYFAFNMVTYPCMI